MDRKIASKTLIKTAKTVVFNKSYDIRIIYEFSNLIALLDDLTVRENFWIYLMFYKIKKENLSELF